MSRILFPIVLFLILAYPVFSQEAQELPSADQLLKDVQSYLPQEQLKISGDLVVRKRKGVVASSCKFEILLKLGDQPPLARYTIRDNFGDDLEELTITRRRGQEPEFRYKKGDISSVTDQSGMHNFIQGTDISWMDLTLSFLYWKGGTHLGTELLKGQSCFVVEVPAPRSDVVENAKYNKVKIWIDRKMHMILQAEGYDSEDKLVSRLWVKSFKKINERWMIKDMEIQSFPLLHRTRLLIREVQE